MLLTEYRRQGEGKFFKKKPFHMRTKNFGMFTRKICQCVHRPKNRICDFEVRTYPKTQASFIFFREIRDSFAEEIIFDGIVNLFLG